MTDKFVEKVSDFIREKGKEISAEVQSWVITELEECFVGEREISSPVEQLFFIEHFCREYRSHWNEGTLFNLTPQYKDKSTGKYRLDFLVDFVGYAMNTKLNLVISEKAICSIEPPKLAIEIDGHIWHEKTKKQVQHHKERERFLVAHEWRLLRFTGSEVFESPGKCLNEVADVANSLALEWIDKLKKFDQKENKNG